MNANTEFMHISVCFMGSIHDSLAFNVSKLMSQLSSGRVPPPFHLVGDDAYRAVTV